VNIRPYERGDENAQVTIYNEAAGQLPRFKPATLDEVRRRLRAPDFDASMRLYAVEGGRVVGYATFHANGRISYPWCLPGQEAHAEPLLQAVLEALRKRGQRTAFAAYRNDWGPQREFLLRHGFAQVREMINFVLDLAEMPTPAPRPGTPLAALKREDVKAVFELAPEALRVSTPAELERHLFENPYFPPESVFVLRSRGEAAPVAVGVLVQHPAYANPKQVDAAMPCFRLGAFGTEGMTTKRINGLFSLLARNDRSFTPLALDLMGQAAFRLREGTVEALAAQVPSDVPHLLRFYQQHFRPQGSFPIFERAL
jgi:hypothetical protein